MNDPISATRLSELVTLIYDSAIEPERWPVAMDAIRSELHFHNAALDLILLPSGKVLSNLACNLPQQYEAMVASSGPALIESWGGAAVVQRLPMDRPAVLTHVNPALDFATTNNPYLVNFARPQGLIDVLAIGLARDARALGSLAFGRHESAGPISPREIAVAQLLVPHLQRAATINRLLENATTIQAGMVATLDTVAVPIMLLDADLRILHANAAAHRHLADKTLIHETEGRLGTASLGASTALTVAIVQAARDESTIGRRGLGVPIVGQLGAVGALHVLPLRQRWKQFHSGAVAAAFLAEVDVPFVAPTEMAAALFRLTPAEARVFEHLVTGRTQATIAKALGVERSTVKSHLARLYDKVGVRRQVDLLRIAASLAIPALTTD